jgi:fumarate reductase subunit C
MPEGCRPYARDSEDENPGSYQRSEVAVDAAGREIALSKEKPFPEYRRKLGPGWWLSNSHFTQYMVREWTSFFVSVFSIIYIYELWLFASGARNSALALMRNPGIIAFNVAALVFTLYHAFTWFYLIGKVQPIKIGRTTSKPWQALLVNIVLLLIVSYVVIQILVLR